MKRVVTFAIFCFLGLLADWVACATGGEWSDRFFSSDTQAILNAAAAQQSSEARVVVLLDEVTYTFDVSGNHKTRSRLSYKILNQSGAETWSTAEMEWSPWYQQRPQIQARVIAPDGTPLLLDPKTIDDAPAQDPSDDVYTDNRIVQAPLPGIVPGAVVEQEISIEETSPVFNGGIVESFYFGRSVPVEQSRVIIEYPASLPLRYVQRLLPDIKPERTESNGVVRLKFESGRIEVAPDPEPGQPSDVPRWPYVAFSTATSWQEVATRYAKTVEEQIQDAGLKTMVAGTVGDAKDSAEIAARLLKKLHQEIRYTGIEFADASIIPRRPSEIFARKYGDCKDTAALFVAMLRATGIPANVALLKTGPGKDLEPDLPGFGMFDHAIVYIPGTTGLWIDTTDEYSRVNELAVADQDRLALIVSPETTQLTRTPVYGSEANRTLQTREFFLSEIGPARVIETIEQYGSPERGSRSYYRGGDRKEIRKSLEQYVKSAYLAKNLVNFEHSDPLDMTKPFQLRLEAGEADRGTTSEKEAVVAIFLSPLIEDLPGLFRTDTEEENEQNEQDAKPRKTDYILAQPYVYEIRYRIVPSPGFRPATLPQSEEVSIGPAKLTKRFETSADNVVNVLLRFDTVKRRLTAEEYEALKKNVAPIEDAEAILVHYEQIGESYLAAGRIKEALIEFRRLAALHPTEALHRSQIAGALLKGGMGDAARRVAAEAVKLEPRSALAYRKRAWILQHDTIGRFRKKGYDLQEAIASLRKAKELDPKDVFSRADLAILLEFDEDAVRYSEKAKLREAIDEYRSLRNDLKNKRLDTNLMTALMWAGQYQELMDFTRTLDASDERNKFFVVAAVAQLGFEQGIAATHQFITDPAAQRQALEAAGRQLILLRLYPAAASVLQKAVEGSEKRAMLQGQVEAISRTVRYDEFSLSDADPEMLIRSLMVSLYRSRKIRSYESFLSYFTEHTRHAMTPADIEQMDALMTGLEKSPQLKDIPFDVAADIGLSALRFAKEGNDDVGYRIQVTTSVGSSLKQTYFVIKENGKYRVLSESMTPWVLGGEALRLIELGNLTTARQWLDWAREVVSPAGGNDPLAGPVFPRFWTKGNEADGEKMKTAAAILLTGDPQCEAAIPVLLSAGEKTESEEQRTGINLALMHANIQLKRYDDALAIASTLQDQYQESIFLYRTRLFLFQSLERWQEAKALADHHLQKEPDDPASVSILTYILENEGDYETGKKLEQQLIDRGKADAETYNGLAWLSLFNGKLTDQSIETARRAVDLRACTKITSAA